jgi:hypothetical protein
MNMNMAGTLDNQINKAAFWSAIALLLVTVPSLFLPLDAPDGPFADRVVWFSSNLGVFIVGWIVQIIAMLALSAVFAGALWQIANTHPLRAIVAGTTLLVSVVAFIIPKFIAVWSIPQMVAASATASAHSAVAEQLLQLLNVSLPFSLFASFDYLGFWLYAVFSLLIARPLFRLTLSAKIAAVGFGTYGLLFHIILIGVLTRNVVQTDIVPYVMSVAGLLLVAVISMAVYFRRAMASGAGE